MTTEDIVSTLLRRAEEADWVGADPYDGLASGLGALVIPFGPLPRFALSQTVLRSALARGIASPPHLKNPKGLALFLGATARGRRELGDKRAVAISAALRIALFGESVPSGAGRGWGYPFPWQSRSFWAPAGTPNTVVTATAGWHLLEAGEALSDLKAVALGLSAAVFLSHEMRFARVGDGLAISYTARDSTRVVNLSALAARLFARVARGQPLSRWRELADQLTQFVLGAQRHDGSWSYAVDRGGEWEDSFHTGFILEALLDLRRLGVSVPRDAVTRGFAAYERFFEADGGARLFPQPESPLDAHSAAQGIVAFAALHSADDVADSESSLGRKRALAIADWARDVLWLPSKGHFAYRIHKGRRDEHDYARWVQAWMALAMATASRLEKAEADIQDRPLALVAQ